MTVTTEMRGEIAVISMDDGKANAVNHSLLDGLDKAFDTVGADAKAIVLAGRPGLFSGGFDLGVMRGAAPDEVQALVDRGGEFLVRLLTCQKPQ